MYSKLMQDWMPTEAELQTPEWEYEYVLDNWKEDLWKTEN